MYRNSKSCRPLILWGAFEFFLPQLWTAQLLWVSGSPEDFTTSFRSCLFFLLCALSKVIQSFIQMALCLRAEDHSRRWSAGICPPGSKSEGELTDGIAPAALGVGLDMVCCGPGKKSTGWWSASFPADLPWSSWKQWHWANQSQSWHSEPDGVLRAVTHIHVLSLAAGWRATEQATKQWDERTAETAVKTQREGESTCIFSKGTTAQGACDQGTLCLHLHVHTPSNSVVSQYPKS